MNAAAKALIETLVMMGAQGTLVALVALAVVRGGRLRPGWQAAVWLVVLAKFVLPWGPAMRWSLADLLAGLRHHHDAGPLIVAPRAAHVAAPEVSGAWLLLAIAWLTVAAIMLARAWIAQRRVTRAARRAPPAPARAQALLASFSRRPPRLVVGDPAVGPHVVGILRPVIVIPPALLDEPALLCPAVLHELAHVRRRDALARVVQVVAGAVFFFWPFVRIASRRLDLSREAACDAWALEVSEVAPPAYARLLVRMAKLQVAAASSMGAPHGLDARVAAVLGPPARRAPSVLHGAALLAWIALALGGARTAAARGDHVCKYTPELAEALRQVHPEADLDGDGVLSRGEACAFQAELRKRVDTPDRTDLVLHTESPELERFDASLLKEPLCCNCSSGAEDSAPGAPWISQRSDACASTKE